jgi:hypothetical protein
LTDFTFRAMLELPRWGWGDLEVIKRKEVCEHEYVTVACVQQAFRSES